MRRRRSSSLRVGTTVNVRAFTGKVASSPVPKNATKCERRSFAKMRPSSDVIISFVSRGAGSDTGGRGRSVVVIASPHRPSW